MATVKEYWRTWLWRDAVTKIITVNFMVWLALSLAHIMGWGGAVFLLAMPTYVELLPLRFWTVFTYMFTQTDFLHMFVNMMWVLLFGQLLLGLQGGMRLGLLYVTGGLAGAVCVLVCNMLSLCSGSLLMGASCAVLALVGAAMTLYPGFTVQLFIFGPVKLVWLSAAAIVLFVVAGADTAQTIAHAAGLAAGLAYGLGKKRGVDLLAPLVAVCRKVAGRKVYEARAAYRGKKPDASMEAELDALLEKVGRSGYGSLTAAERQRLFDLSQRMKT